MQVFVRNGGNVRSAPTTPRHSTNEKSDARRLQVGRYCCYGKAALGKLVCAIGLADGTDLNALDGDTVGMAVGAALDVLDGDTMCVEVGVALG